ncbi:hypothetical protein BFJ72_g14445 [Fusarium proliferatum]|uniref:Uncharacterized protein n=1 Tax=Gibberella intermedia TaxID=948311 RepID=A0A420S2V5_GIBIN|nr:hypothetical protein BFJ72_g14445 [Fusarium proliferatum]
MSGLEPLAALGLVCNIVQLVEVGLKTATLCKNAYRTGEPDPELSVYAQNLAVTAATLSQSLQHSQQPLDLSDSRLLTLARNCRDAEAEWRNKTPARFLSQQQPRKRDRLGAVFRGIINKPEIDRLESQLQKAKDSLETDLLVRIFKSLDVSKVQANDLQDKFRDLLQATSTSEQKLHDLIQTQVALINTQISDRIDQAEASTKAHVTTELASHESRLKSHADHGKDTILTEAEARENIRRENEAYERLLHSFQYPDMNRRRNEIHASYGSTFNWLFEGKFEDDHLGSEASQSGYQSESRSGNEADSYPGELARSSFGTWLKSTENHYWISGRPGTGKSVLMKFIISHEQTMDSLRQWHSEAQILSHFFWKVGSPMQSSFKGFLCSLVYQLLSSDKQHAMNFLRKNPDWSRKTRPGDWDKDDLKFLAHRYARQSARPFCLFIDGLDEIVDDEGVGILTDFLDTLQEASRLVKICMSSRPESAIRMRIGRNPNMKMQDLTRNDIEQYARANLKKEVSLANSSICIEDLVMDISDKAQGVFLWAVLVTRSVARGISNGDSRDLIQKRLRKTPKKLHELYLDMWTRLGEDSDLYQRSTALIFKIVLFHWKTSHRLLHIDLPSFFYIGALSILELMLASSDDLWSMPVRELDKLSATNLEQQCQELLTRLPFRTADLLEVVIFKRHERLDEKQWAGKSHSRLFNYDNLGVEAVHRTVFDFLIETEDGKKIMGHHKASQEELFMRMFRSRLLQNCLCPYVRYSPGDNEEDRNWQSSWEHLDSHLELLSYHTDTIHSSTLVKMLDALWASFVQMTKSLPIHPDPSVSIVKRICKFDYLLRVAREGFDDYLRDYLIEWENNRQFDELYKVIEACLEFDGTPPSDFGWAGKQRLIQRILSIIVSHRFHISTPNGEQLSSNTLVKASIASFLISAVDTFRFLQWNTFPACSWDAQRTSIVLGMIRDFRYSLCLGDRMLVPVFLFENIIGIPNLVSCIQRLQLGPPAVYVEISISILIQIFLEQVVQKDAGFNRHEVEDALKLKDGPQTVKPAMLGGGGVFFELSSTDLPIFQRYCHSRLLLEVFSPSIEDSEDAKWCEKRFFEAYDDTIKRMRRGETPAGAASGIEEGAGPNGMNFYLCSSCEAREKCQP